MIPPRVTELMKVFVVWHGETMMKVFKLSGGKMSQDAISNPSTRDQNKQLLEQKRFFAIVVVEEEVVWMNRKRNKINIEKGSLLIWRGDYRLVDAAFPSKPCMFIEIE